ncbi:MAG TPA: oxygen-independent coproporphyrinogen III oxidase [Gammaproteobacteria bacterium]|nr:oxygen-independent coproporphyrinogen III oxidase [Gammaproteobacteria bacterium]
MQANSAISAIGFDPYLVRRYDVAGPRYTSYPTARQFGSAVDTAVYQYAVKRSNEDFIPSALSLYMHLPFCKSPCFYCGCSRLITSRPERIAAYLQRLYSEIHLQGSHFDRDRPVRQLHLGGGTPTYLSDQQLADLFNILRKAFTLEERALREFSIEADPRGLTPQRLQILANFGFNRISYGFQDFDPQVQEAINRVQDAQQCLELIGAARAAGFCSVSADLIYGLPKQTEAGFTATLEAVAGARPDRVAVYGYAHLPQYFKAQQHIHNIELPNADLRLRLLQRAVEVLSGHGYEYLGMDHFALPDDELVQARTNGTLQRNFQGYSTHAGLDLVGLGMTAISHVGDVYAQNAKTLDCYYAALDSGHLPIERGYVMSADDCVRADVIGRLMCYEELPFDPIERRHNIVFLEYFARELVALQPLEADRLVRVETDRLLVLPRGRFLRRALAMVFDAYLPREKTAHTYSRVV